MTNWDPIVTRLAAASVTVEAALAEAKVARHKEGRRPTLPAQPPTEEQIVAALKADPAMAGRVMAVLADKMWASDVLIASGAARDAMDSPACSAGAYGSLQSLAVALAAASYRG